MAHVAQPSQRYASKRLFYLSVLSAVIILIGGGVSLLLKPTGTRFIAAADGVSVVGPPSLTASTVNAIFTRLGSPMAGTGNVVVQASRDSQIDDAFALAVWWTETNDGEAGTGRPYGDRNPAGVRGSIGYPRDAGGYTIYPSYAAAIEYWFNMIRHNYVDRGMATVYAISYPYTGTSSSPLWAAKVTRLMFEYRGEAPPPTAIPTIMPISTVTPRPVVSPVVPGTSNQHTQPPELDDRAFAGNTQVHQHVQYLVSTKHTAGSARDATTLRRWIDLGIMLFALLTVLAGAIWVMRAMRSKRSKHLAPAWEATRLPFTLPLRTTSSLLLSDDKSESYASQPLYYNQTFGAPITEALEVDMARVLPLSLPGMNRETDPRIRRVTLMPSQVKRTPVTREPVAVGAHPAGLLTRYREMQQTS